ncbi:MAG: anhydro-N-acetylmuramic acid kinase [Pseudomonadales bacterium]
MANYFIGLMSGTSMDAVDTAVVDFSGSQPHLIAYEQYPIDPDTKTSIRKINTQSPVEEVSRQDYLIGEMFATAVNRILADQKIASRSIVAIGCHGQTILHLPDSPEPRTMQIGDPNIIAERTGIATAADFRRMDMAAGGQGAPLAPAFHDQVFRKTGINRAILNIGGIANLSLLSADPSIEIMGFDTGPGNGLMDDWCQRHLGKDMDENSDWASTGKLIEELLIDMLSDPYFEMPAPKSSGRDYFNIAWIESKISRLGCDPRPEDVQATLLELTRRNICDAIENFARETQEIYVCGGGVHNKRLMQSIRDTLHGKLVTDTHQLGIDPDAVEAVTFAWLAKCRLEGTSGNSPSVTGAKARCVLGGLYLPPSAR